MVPPSPRDPHGQQRRCAQQGFTLIETLIGAAILAIALLGHSSATLSGHKLARTESAHSRAIHITQQFLERLRSDEDWPGLYMRLRELQEQVEGTVGAGPELNDGRTTWAPGTYYEDFYVPKGLLEVGVRVDVPAGAVGSVGAASEVALRETLIEHDVGLPADLNGDGVIDEDSRDDDYLALPVTVTFVWTTEDGNHGEMRVVTWLRGMR